VSRAAPPLRVLVADDEAVARRRLRRLLGALPDVEVVGEAADGAAVLARVGQGDVDVVLLDIQMPGVSGIEALQLFPEDGPVVVFATAHAEHAVSAFDAGAVDYLLKPVEAARLRRALDRARDAEARRRFRDEVARQRAAAPRPPPPAASSAAGMARLALPTRKGIVLVDPARVSHAVLEGELVTVHTDEGSYFCDLALAELETRLPADRFVRVHRRALVNLEAVARFEPTATGGFVAHTRGGAAVEVSRQAARELRRRLGVR
jgi:two-component system LytT family response regulator